MKMMKDQIARSLLLALLLASPVRAAPIDRAEAVDIGGIKQWLRFQGEDDTAPVLLILHGGPGDSMMAYAARFTELQKHLVVVNWDQRETGKTAELNASPVPLTVSLLVSDAVEVIRFLCARFSRQKIYLVGHSWGGYLGLRVAAVRPDLLSGYFASSPMIHQRESERMALATMLTKAKSEDNHEAVAELEQVRIPFETGTQLFYHRKWLSRLLRRTPPRLDDTQRWAITWLSVFNDASGTNFRQFAPELKCPVYFLIGRKDQHTHFSLADSYFQNLVCPKKDFFWFENSSHSPQRTELARWQKVILDTIGVN